MIAGTTLKSVEKKFGPALPGAGEPDKTFSAIRYAAGKGKKYAGLPGIRSDAVFLVHFPVAVDLSQIKVAKKGPADFIKDLAEDGPQSSQGRQAEVQDFLLKHAEVEKKLQIKRQLLADKMVRKLAEEKLKGLLGEKTVTIEINGQRLSGVAKITFGKKTKKLKVSVELEPPVF